VQAAKVDAPAGSRRSESGWKKEAAAPARPRVPLSPRPNGAALTGGPTTAAIRLDGVNHSFVIAGRHTPVLNDVRFELADGSVTAIVGPNGSGKSTLLRLIAGLITPDGGTVALDGKHVEAADPRVGLVFQEPRLLPWRRAIDNVALPLELAGADKPVRRALATDLLALVGLDGFAEAYPHQLSGGMRQRVAIARALARDPSVLLLDEPFSALDSLTRERFNAELLDLWARTGTTIVLVTHSVSEAVFLADTVLVLSPRPGTVVARVAVPLPRPRAADTLDGTDFQRTAATIRAHLAGTPAEQLAQEEAAPRVPDVLERSGTPAWFDPFGGGA
jgi:NitT/TauT family transport system ATP-binding protein